MSDLLAGLRRILPSSAIRTRAHERAVYECDGLSIYREQPAVVVLPETEQQVAATLALCHARGVPIVPRGAGTGLSGGALPHKEGVLLVLSRMNRILAVDPANRQARVQPGVRNLAISEAAAPYGLFYAPDPSSQVACSIGGNIAENAGGVHCLKYGLTVHNLLALRWVDAAGEIHVSGGTGFDGPGLDLLAALTGSEGLLGIVVEATVRLLPKPACSVVLLVAFPELPAAGAAVAAIIAAGVVPAGLEVMDRLAVRAAEAYVHAGYPLDAAAILLVELDGDAGDVEDQIAAVEAACQAYAPSAFVLARDPVQRALLWAGRKAAFAAVGRLAPDYYCMDGTIPRGKLAQVLAVIEQLSAHYDLPVANVFHAGDGNLHPLILFDASKPDELARALAFGARILEQCLEVGGSITGEHGVGVEKIDQMCLQFPAAVLRQFHDLKRAFDTAGILNPGKAVPTLARCAEFGQMHVHAGELNFPAIERF